MRQLILARHSKPEIERARPASDWRLGEEGRCLSELLAVRLSGFNPGLIWSSREPKAVETAQVVAGLSGVPVKVKEGLGEHHRDTVPFFTMAGDFQGAVEQFFRKPDRPVLGTETAEQSLARFRAAVDEIIGAECTDSLAITHGTVMTLYVAHVAGIDPVPVWRRLGTPSYVVLELPDMRVSQIVESVVK